MSHVDGVMPARNGDTASADHAPVPVLAMHSVTKRFGATVALDGAHIELYAGEVHALVGENGAGKSTLIKVMTGLHQPDEGQILLDGAPVDLGSSRAAQDRGVVAIYQEPMIFPDLTVAENIFIGHRDRGRIVDRRRMRTEAEQVLARLGVRLDVGEPARGLTLENLGTVDAGAKILFKIGSGVPWTLQANFNGRMPRVTNATLAKKRSTRWP